MILEIEHPLFTYEHLFDSEENVSQIGNFYVSEKSGLGLENYLKNVSVYDEKENLNATYLLKDKMTKEIAGFFSLRAGLFTIAAENSTDFDSIPAVELSNFAVNSEYRKNHPELKSIGQITFTDFIIPIAQHIKNYIAVKALYIYAIPEEKLIKHYQRLGFSRLEQEEEDFVHSHVKPKYDDGCIFMYQIL